MEKKLTFALLKNKLVNIGQVESGLKCNCFCPYCKATLVAKKGKIKQHHFAHYNADECEAAYETAVHLLAKEIIKEEKRMVIPALDYFDSTKEELIELTKPKEILFDSVELEVRYGDFQPDIVATIGSKKIFIEIAVTHFVDDEKLTKLKECDTSTIEIDLSNLKIDFTKQQLESILVETVSNKKWLFSNQKSKLIKKYQEKKKILDEELIAKWEKESAWYKYKIEKAKYYNYQILESNESDEICCPKLLKEEIKDISINHSIFNKLKEFNYWDGGVYKNAFGAKYVTIDNEVYFFTPNINELNSLSSEEVDGLKLMWSVLNQLSINTKVNPQNCKSCEYFDDYIRGNFEVSCKYNTDLNLKTKHKSN